MANLISLLALIISITIHEFSHALVADRLGDPTPRSYGRLTLNPLAHADLFGTILLPLLSAISGIPTIGWAKPVPIDSYNFSQPKRDEILVSLAGPASNLLLAVITFFLAKTFGLNYIFIYLIIAINVSLAVFNLLPIPPLDGSKILLNILPEQTSVELESAFNQYGIFLLFLLLFIPIGNTSALNFVMSPIVNLLLSILTP